MPFHARLNYAKRASYSYSISNPSFRTLCGNPPEHDRNDAIHRTSSSVSSWKKGILDDDLMSKFSRLFFERIRKHIPLRSIGTEQREQQPLLANQGQFRVRFSRILVEWAPGSSLDSCERYDPPTFIVFPTGAILIALYNSAFFNLQGYDTYSKNTFFYQDHTSYLYHCQMWFFTKRERDYAVRKT